MEVRKGWVKDAEISKKSLDGFELEGDCVEELKRRKLVDSTRVTVASLRSRLE
jgi:hypothetical protein